MENKTGSKYSIEELFKEAKKARDLAYAKYSNFKVGAVVID